MRRKERKNKMASAYEPVGIKKIKEESSEIYKTRKLERWESPYDLGTAPRLIKKLDKSKLVKKIK